MISSEHTKQQLNRKCPRCGGEKKSDQGKLCQACAAALSVMRRARKMRMGSLIHPEVEEL